MAEKRNWKEIVEKSNGTSCFLPDKFRGEMNEIEKNRKELNVFLNEAAERKISLKVKTENLFLAVRKYLAANGISTVWSKDLGLDVNALADGEYVINFGDTHR